MNSRVRSHWEHMDLEVKTSLSQACLLLPAPRKLEAVIPKICLLQFFKSLSNFNTVTLYSQKSGSVNSRAVFPSCFYCFWLCATFPTNDIRVWGLTPGSLCSCRLLFLLLDTHLLLTLHCRQLSLQTPVGTSGNCWGHRSLQQSEDHWLLWPTFLMLKL